MTAIAPTEADGVRGGWRRVFVQLARQRELGVAALIAVTFLVVGVVNRDFLRAAVIRDMLVAAAPFAIVGCGLTFVIVTGEIDISVGSLAALCAVVVAKLSAASHGNVPVPLAVLIMLGVATTVGLINGLLVTLGRVPSIIVTLGTMTVLRYPTQKLIGGTWITSLPAGLRYFGTGAWFGVPISIWMGVVTALAAVVLARHTPLGRRIYAAGSSPSAARLAGISTTRIKLFAFTLTGFLVGVATLISATQLDMVDTGATGFELVVVTAVVVGGTSISGGKGTIVGTMLGVILLSMIGKVLTFLKLGPDAVYWERAIQGAFILLAVLFDHLGRHRRAVGEGDG
jgi:ribose/xylose/arabinose/galactoside ABC-type transport system permease subunit